MRLAIAGLVLAGAALARAASAQPTAVPTPAGAGAVTPSDQTAVKPALPDERANGTVELGTPPPTPAPLPVPSVRPSPAGTALEPGRSEPDTGTSPAAAGSVHKKPGVAGKPVSVSKAPPYTVVAFEAGKSVTLRRPEGTLVTYPLARNADVPKRVGPGLSVTVKTRAEHGTRVVTRMREAGDVPVLTNVN